MAKHAIPLNIEGGYSVFPLIRTLMVAYGCDKAVYEQGYNGPVVTVSKKAQNPLGTTTQMYVRVPVFTADTFSDDGAQGGIVTKLRLHWESEDTPPTAEELMRILAQR